MKLKKILEKLGIKKQEDKKEATMEYLTQTNYLIDKLPRIIKKEIKREKDKSTKYTSRMAELIQDQLTPMDILREDKLTIYQFSSEIARSENNKIVVDPQITFQLEHDRRELHYTPWFSLESLVESQRTRKANGYNSIAEATNKLKNALLQDVITLAKDKGYCFQEKDYEFKTVKDEQRLYFQYSLQVTDKPIEINEALKKVIPLLEDFQFIVEKHAAMEKYSLNYRPI